MIYLKISYILAVCQTPLLSSVSVKRKKKKELSTRRDRLSIAKAFRSA